MPLSPAPINLDFHKMHKLDKDHDSNASSEGKVNLWQHNCMPVEETV